MKKAWFQSTGPPNSTQNRAQTHKNAKVEAKISWKTILEALETNFGPQDNDFEGQDSDFGGHCQIVWLCWEVFEVAQRNAQGL